MANPINLSPRFDYLGLTSEEVKSQLELIANNDIGNMYISKGQVYVNQGWFKGLSNWLTRSANEDLVIQKHVFSLAGYSIQQKMTDPDLVTKLLDSIRRLDVSRFDLFKEEKVEETSVKSLRELDPIKISKKLDALKGVQETSSIFKKSNNAKRYAEIVKLNTLLRMDNINQASKASQLLSFIKSCKNDDAKIIAILEYLIVATTEEVKATSNSFPMNNSNLIKKVLDLDTGTFIKIYDKLNYNLKITYLNEKVESLLLTENSLSKIADLYKIQQKTNYFNNCDIKSLGTLLNAIFQNEILSGNIELVSNFLRSIERSYNTGDIKIDEDIISNIIKFAGNYKCENNKGFFDNLLVNEGIKTTQLSDDPNQEDFQRAIEKHKEEIREGNYTGSVETLQYIYEFNIRSGTVQDQIFSYFDEAMTYKPTLSFNKFSYENLVNLLKQVNKKEFKELYEELYLAAAKKVVLSKLVRCANFEYAVTSDLTSSELSLKQLQAQSNYKELSEVLRKEIDDLGIDEDPSLDLSKSYNELRKLEPTKGLLQNCKGIILLEKHFSQNQRIIQVAFQLFKYGNIWNNQWQRSFNVEGEKFNKFMSSLVTIETASEEGRASLDVKQEEKTDQLAQSTLALSVDDTTELTKDNSAMPVELPVTRVSPEEEANLAEVATVPSNPLRDKTLQDLVTIAFNNFKGRLTKDEEALTEIDGTRFTILSYQHGNDENIELLDAMPIQWPTARSATAQVEHLDERTFVRVSVRERLKYTYTFEKLEAEQQA